MSRMERPKPEEVAARALGISEHWYLATYGEDPLLAVETVAHELSLQKSRSGRTIATVTDILTDLIAELREQRNYSDSEHGFYWRIDRIQDATDRAEARLKGLNDE